MPSAHISRDEVVAKLFEVFRDRGFDGASLSDLSQATGLGRSSLYHYFPGGKDQMAGDVLAWVSQWLHDHLLGSDDAALRPQDLARALEAMFEGGQKACVLAQMTGGSAADGQSDNLKSAFEIWVAALTKAAQAQGASPKQARQWAEDRIAALEGGLILSRGMDASGAYERAIKALKAGWRVEL